MDGNSPSKISSTFSSKSLSVLLKAAFLSFDFLSSTGNSLHFTVSGFVIAEINFMRPYGLDLFCNGFVVVDDNSDDVVVVAITEIEGYDDFQKAMNQLVTLTSYRLFTNISVLVITTHVIPQSYTFTPSFTVKPKVDTIFSILVIIWLSCYPI